MSLSITPSDIIQYLYCPRFIYFERVMHYPQFEEKEVKVQKGRELHDKKLEDNKAYLRKRLGVQEKWQEVYLSHGALRGQVDEVLRLDDGTFAPLDYKFAKYEEKLYTTYKTQVFCYAWLIAQNYGVEVNRGFIVYTRSKDHHVETIPVSAEDLASVSEAVEAVASVAGGAQFPPATRVRSRCKHCTYSNICAS